MNILVKNYCVMVEFPDVSGAEHLEMLQLRDELAKVEFQLSEEEKGLLANADGRWEHLSFVKSIFFIVVRASPLAYCTIRERGRSHCKCKTEMLPGRLVEQAREFYEELSRFVDLTQKRKFEEITPQRWWWYLDVLALLPNLRKQELTSGVV